MSECMMFPKNWEKFLEDYSFKDKEEVYTNGSQLVPVFRVEQMVEYYFLANGVGVIPAIPGPSESDPNIMELCFHNGENHMRDKIKTSLLKLSGDMPCVPINQVIKIMEDL